MNLYMGEPSSFFLTSTNVFFSICLLPHMQPSDLGKADSLMLQPTSLSGREEFSLSNQH